MKGKRRTIKRVIATILTMILIVNIPAGTSLTKVVEAASLNIVEDFEFESPEAASYQGNVWGNPVKELVTDAHNGTYALQLSSRTADWNVYAYNISRFQGKTIKIEAYMKVNQDDLKAVACVKWNDGTKDKYDWAASADVVNGSWVKLDATYQVPSTATDLYFMTSSSSYQGTTDTYLLDDVSIVEVVNDSATPSILENFNDATDTSNLLGKAMGGPTLRISDELVTGSKSLAVTNRTQDYFGYSYNLSEFAGNTISLSAKLSAYEMTEETKTTFKATLATKTGDAAQYNTVAQKTVTGSALTLIETQSYQVPADCDSYTLYFETAKDVDYIIDDVEIKIVGEYIKPSNPEDNAGYVDYSGYQVLKDLYSPYFKLGVACEAISNWNNKLSEIGNKYKEGLIRNQFNSITFGNELKAEYNMGWRSADATDTNLPFTINSAAKEMLNWAKDNNIQVRGHVLIWHAQTANAAFCKDYKTIYVDSDNKILDPNCLVDRDTMLARMRSYIYNTMEYMYKNGYAETIYAWDVVNEAIEVGANEYNLRDSYWYKIIGADFMYYAFQYAREAVKLYSQQYADLYQIDPTSTVDLEKIQPSLFYNDYNEYVPSKRDATIKALHQEFNGRSIIGDGLIDGIGMQGHVSDTNDIDGYITALQMFAAEVEEVQITELDVKQTTTGVNADHYQSVYYYKLFSKLVEQVKNGVNLTSVTIWGLTDDNSWIKNGNPLIFKGDLSKKLAFDAMVNVVTGDPMPEPTYVAPDFSDVFVDFESAKDATTPITPADVGFTKRGNSVLTVQSEEVFQGNSSLHVSGRTSNWHGVCFDVSNFVGQTIAVSAWVKSEASQVKLSADINEKWPNIAQVDTSKGEWVQILGTYKIPNNLTALNLYLETNDTSDIYVDNVKVRLVGMDEGFEEEKNIASARGVGHMPSVTVVNTESHNGSGHSYQVKRTEQDATMSFNVTPYIGRTVKVSAYVKTTDSKITLGLDRDTPVKLIEVDALENDWTFIETTCMISKDYATAKMYIETNGAADFFVDDIKVTIGDYVDDVEDGTLNFTTRWGGAGTISRVEDGADNHAVLLTDRTGSYYGVAFDVSEYLGMEVEVSVDVKTDDRMIRLSGDIADQWPNYAAATSTPGTYKTITAFCNLPKDLTKLNLYIETDGTSDLYVDNLRISRVLLGREFKVTYNTNGHGNAIASQVITEGRFLVEPNVTTDDDSKFDGWYKEDNYINRWDFLSDQVTSNMTLYAKWIEPTAPTVTPTPVVDLEQTEKSTMITLNHSEVMEEVDLDDFVANAQQVGGIVSIQKVGPNLPEGLVYNEEPHVISGTPTKVGKTTVIYRITAKNGKKMSLKLTFVVKASKNQSYTEGNFQYRLIEDDISGVGKVMVVGLSIEGLKKTTLKVPSTVKIGHYQYQVTVIGKDAFLGVKKLKHIILNDEITRIEDSAFKNCAALEKVTIGSSEDAKLETIGNQAFYGCKSIVTIKIYSKYLISVGSDVFFKVPKSAKVYVPEEALTQYKVLFKKAGMSSESMNILK